MTERLNRTELKISKPLSEYLSESDYWIKGVNGIRMSSLM